MEAKNVSIIIPVKPRGKVNALDAFRHVDYPAAAVEIIVAEGKCPSRQRNMAAAAAGGTSSIFSTTIRWSFRVPAKAVSHFENPSVATSWRTFPYSQV
jgi:hypothetical protein